jgi:hypothetical protein
VLLGWLVATTVLQACGASVQSPPPEPMITIVLEERTLGAALRRFFPATGWTYTVEAVDLRHGPMSEVFGMTATACALHAPAPRQARIDLQLGRQDGADLQSCSCCLGPQHIDGSILPRCCSLVNRAAKPRLHTLLHGDEPLTWVPTVGPLRTPYRTCPAKSRARAIEWRTTSPRAWPRRPRLRYQCWGKPPRAWIPDPDNRWQKSSTSPRWARP